MVDIIGIHDHVTHRNLYYYPSNKMILESYAEFVYV